ncbi:hypothetical protein E8E12_003830 [Didymella heteroderae]|uniref:Uncharacterized protein n=1 Tax=Didymella heteroderae TaxID=1769908 RepID=A0A9P5BXQ4_9PLEO|nr:hypothetical protein E8E12_003830 [Didymella heteroderae]
MLRPSYKHLVLLGSPVVSQINFGTPGSQGNRNYSGSQICNRTFAEANSTGEFSVVPYMGIDDTISWATTAYQDHDATELSLWFSPSRNYTDHFDLGYDVCYFWIDGLMISSIERGQSDSGRCM